MSRLRVSGGQMRLRRTYFAFGGVGCFAQILKRKLKESASFLRRIIVAKPPKPERVIRRAA